MVLAPSNSLADDAATIVFKSGVSIELNSGYKELAKGLQSFTEKGSENYYKKIESQGNTFHINLGTIAILCRNRCSSIKLATEKK